MSDAAYPATTPFGTDTLLADDAFFPSSGQGLDIGFNFPFYCVTYNRIYINPNGFITPGAKASGQYDDTDNYALPLLDLAWPGSNPEFFGIPMIAPLWADALTEHTVDANIEDPANNIHGKMWYRLDTTTSPKTLVVTRDDVFHWYGWWNGGLYGHPNTTGNNMQLILYQDGRIQINHGDMGWSGVDTSCATEGTVGIYSGGGSPDGNCQGQATPYGEFYPHDTNFANKQLLYLPDTDSDNIPDDGDASGVAGDNFCTSLQSPPSFPYKPPVSVDCDDNCPAVMNPFQDDNEDQADSDFDDIGDACDPDDDHNGIPDVSDNCPLVAGANLNDYDADGLGDICDPDADNDGLLNQAETSRNWLDPDSDDDNYTDFEEYWHNGQTGYQFIIKRDTNPLDPDTDKDGLLDGDEVHLYGYNPLQADANSNGIPDGNEDFDGDGLINSAGVLPLNFNYRDGDVNASSTVDAADVVIIRNIALAALTPTLLICSTAISHRTERRMA